MTVQLELNNISAGYEQHPVLHHIDLQVRSGEVLALIGPNGAGKTTLVRVLTRLLRPWQGTVRLQDHDLWRMSPRAVARHLALAAQHDSLAPSFTVEQIVALGRAAHRGWLLPLTQPDHDIVRAAMERTGVAHLRTRRAHDLSGGEKRRVIIARALAQQPAILVLDEPTAHLDLKYQTELLMYMQQLAHDDGLAIVVTLHDLNQAAACADRIALLSAGMLAAVGPPHTVLTRACLEQVYDLTLLVTQHPGTGNALVLPVLEHEHA